MESGESRQQETTARTAKGSSAAAARPKRRKGTKTKSPKTKKRGGFFKAVGLTLGLSALLVAAVGAVLYVRLLYGTISLAVFKPAIESAVNDALGGRTVRMDTTELRLNDNGALVLALTQIAISDPDGTPLALAPQAHASLSWSALRRGRLAVESVELVAPRINVVSTEDGGFALRFARPEATPSVSTPVLSSSPASPTRNDQPTTAEARNIDLIKTIAESSARARRRETATGFLRSIGLRDAVVIMSYGQRRTVWNVSDLHIDLAHRRARSVMTGKATIASLTGPLTIGFATDEAEAADHLDVVVSFNQVNPRGLARLIPGLGFAEQIDMPIDAEAKFVINNATGDIRSASIQAQGIKGEARLGMLGRKAVPLDGARLVAAYTGSTSRVDITEATLGWNGSRVALAGQAQAIPNVAGPAQWAYTLKSTSGVLAGPTPRSPTAKIDQVSASGMLVPSTGMIGLTESLIRVAGAEISAKGQIAALGTAPQGLIEGRISPMSAATLKTIWPTVLAPGVRTWVADHVAKGQLAGGLFKAAIEGGPTRTDPAAEATTRLSLTLEASNVEVLTAKGIPPIEIPRGLLRVEGQTVEITAPEAIVTAAEGRKLQLKTARFTAVETAVGEQPTAEIAFRLNGSLAGVVDIADREAFQLLKSNGVSLPGLDGRVDGQVKATFPLADNVMASEIRAEGRVRVTDLRARNLIGSHDLSGGNVNIDIGDKAVDIKGDLLVKGVAGKLNWQYLINQPMAQQPPIRIVTNLDTADRNALGMDIADIVLGEVPVEATVSWGEGGQMQTRVRADLTKAELTFEPLSWKKAPGKPATFQFDPAKGPGTGTAQRLELQNVRIAGETIAAEGWMAIGPDNKLREYSFPELTVNVVSHLNVQGKRRPDNVWDVTAKGQTFDGRDVFRSLFNVGQNPNAVLKKDKAGVDLTADIDTVIGFSDTTLRTVRIKASQRADKLTDLDLKGTLATGKPFAAQLRNHPSAGRQLLAEGADAGQVFKLVGFYPNAIGGLMQLEVNLDAKGANEKSGTLWARDFAVLGDPVVSEVFQTADTTTAQNQKPRSKMIRQQFDFDGLKIPFDVGSGQFVMNNAVLKGPVIGANFRGKIDFKSQQLNIGGTYVPLSGLNSAVGSILGPLTGGPQGEGLFGITFNVQGSIAAPQVIVNPLSLLGPGIFREIFQLTPENFKITPHQDVPAPTGPPQAKSRGRTLAAPEQPATRSSSAPATEQRAPAAAGARPQGEVLSDWTSETKPSPRKTP